MTAPGVLVRIQLVIGSVKRNEANMFSSSGKITWPALGWAGSIGLATGAEVAVFQTGNTVLMQNEILRLAYDLAGGTYNAMDRRENSVCIKDGRFNTVPVNKECCYIKEALSWNPKRCVTPSGLQSTAPSPESPDGIFLRPLWLCQ